jgi:hypothetical protein
MSKRQFPKNEGYNRIPRFSYVTSNLSKRFSENLMHVLDNEFFETFCSVHWIGGWEFGNKKQNFVANSKSVEIPNHDASRHITTHHDTSRHITTHHDHNSRTKRCKQVATTKITITILPITPDNYNSCFIV